MKRWWSVLVMGALLVLPLLVVSTWLFWNDRWAPVFDMALVEMRVRDVGTSHTPLVGLPGRLGRGTLGCHPGPLVFYLLAPVYRILGGSYGALRVSMTAFNSAAIVSTLLMARRRAGTPAVIAAGFLVALLELGYGPLMLMEPWNPHLPVLWFVTFLAAVWSVACGDLPMLVVAAIAGSICAQTHISYVAMCGGLGLFAFIVAGIAWKRASRHGLPDPGYARWSLAALGVVGVLWAPPLIEQLTDKPGNISVLVDYFTHATEACVGLPLALALVLGHLDAWHIVVDSIGDPGILRDPMPSSPASPVRGLVVFVLWVVAVRMARKLGSRPLLALHGVAGAALVVAAIAISRIVGLAWNYLMFSVCGISAGVFVVVVSTFGLRVWKALPREWRHTRAPHLQALAFAAVAACGVRFAADPEQAGSTTPTPSRQLAVLALATYSAIQDGIGAATGDRGRYFVTWTDALWKGGPGIGLVNELERRGLHVGVDRVYAPMIPMHRVMDPKDATAGIWFGTGAWIDDPGRPRGSLRVAYFDPRSAEERAEFDRIRAEIIAALPTTDRAAANAFDRNIGGARINDFVGLAIARLDVLGVPGAVFIHPIKTP